MSAGRSRLAIFVFRATLLLRGAVASGTDVHCPWCSVGFEESEKGPLEPEEPETDVPLSRRYPAR